MGSEFREAVSGEGVRGAVMGWGRKGVSRGSSKLCGAIEERGEPCGAVVGITELHLASQGGTGHAMEARLGLGTLTTHNFMPSGPLVNK